MRIVFLGTGDIGLPSLEHLLTATSHEVVAVVTQPDKPVGRKQVLTPPEVKVRALAAGVPVLQPE
ncbi:MAG: methionyl-tRNA formyltransferase, partial [Verrucomicrobium sp.]